MYYMMTFFPKHNFCIHVSKYLKVKLKYFFAFTQDTKHSSLFERNLPCLCVTIYGQFIFLALYYLLTNDDLHDLYNYASKLVYTIPKTISLSPLVFGFIFK